MNAALGLAKLQDPKDFDATTASGQMLLDAIFSALLPPSADDVEACKGSEVLMGIR